MRLPLQGGLPPVDAVAGAVVEIACDESGFSGTNLLHPATPVITHASVDLCAGEAVGLIATLRSGFRFSPNTVTVNVGDSVTWTNRDEEAHTATSGSAWSTGDIAGGQSKSLTFRTAGTYDYICAIHPTMTGTLVVRAGTAPATDTALRPTAAGQDSMAIVVILGLASLGGALVGARIVHPCTAFDKWRLVPLVDDDYTVVDAIRTFF